MIRNDGEFEPPVDEEEEVDVVNEKDNPNDKEKLVVLNTRHKEERYITFQWMFTLAVVGSWSVLISKACSIDGEGDPLQGFLRSAFSIFFTAVLYGMDCESIHSPKRKRFITPPNKDHKQDDYKKLVRCKLNEGEAVGVPILEKNQKPEEKNPDRSRDLLKKKKQKTSKKEEKKERSKESLSSTNPN